MLLDTSGLLCFYHRDEPQHPEAVRLFREAPVRVVHNYVLAEFVALCTVRGVARAGAIAFVRAIVDSTLVRVRWVDRDLHAQAVALLDSRPDKDYSLCDAVSFIVMEEAGVVDALTTDRHFEQAGFHRVLLP